MLAPTGPSSQRRLIIAVVAGVAAILLIVGSFLTWASMSMDEDVSEMGMEFSYSAELTVTGMGSADANVDLDTSGLPPEIAEAAENELGNESLGDASEIEDRTKSPGIWTIILGVIVAIGAILIGVRRFPGIGAVIALLGGLAATIATIVFVSAPADSVFKSSPRSGIDVSAGIGLWLALAGALLGLLAGAAAVAVTLRPAQFDDAAPAQLGAPGGFGPQGFGGPQAPGGQAPQGFGGPQAPPAPQGFGQPQAPGGQAPQGYTGQPPQGQPPQGQPPQGQPPQGQPPQGQPPQA
ncbi:hypothetical protein [Gordonia sp. VNK21]|uniref:hypothetical protein n=1 Tax=Gordonia sp. VNK21 TaxID=3382483 RepID=UPI0038D4DD95